MGSPSTYENTARSIIAGLGNDSPSQSQLLAVESWIVKEKGGIDPRYDKYSNNPLNISLGNISASQQYGWLQKAWNSFSNTSFGIALGLPGKPLDVTYSIPQPNAQPGNPILQFPDVTKGIIGNIAGLSQPFASNIRSQLSKPQDISIDAFAKALQSSGWGGPGDDYGSAVRSIFLANTPATIGTNPIGSGDDIGVDSGGHTSSEAAASAADPCSGKIGIDLIGCRLSQLTESTSGILEWVQNPSSWWKLGLSLIGVLAIIFGGVLYAKGHLNVGIHA